MVLALGGEGGGAGRGGEGAGMLREAMAGCGVSMVRGGESRFGDAGRTIPVWLTDEFLLEVRGWRMVSGRFFDGEDVGRGERRMVVTRGLAEELGLYEGATVYLRRVPYEGMGILGDVGGGGGGWDGVAEAHGFLLPWSAPRPWGSGGGEEGMDRIYVRSRSGATFGEDVRRSRELLGQERGGGEGLVWVTPEALLERIRTMQRVIGWTLGGVTGLCLTLGGTILMSVMIGNVRDRVGEIGLRRALGATRGDIAQLFMLEAVVLTAVAGGGAVAVAHGVLGLIGGRVPTPLAFGAMTWGIPVAVSVGVGMMFSYVPARMAARIAPAEALRNE